MEDTPDGGLVKCQQCGILFYPSHYNVEGYVEVDFCLKCMGENEASEYGCHDPYYDEQA